MTRDPRRDVEAVDVRELHVQEDELRTQPVGLRDGAGAVHGLADDLESLGFQEDPGARPERRVVVDDEDGAVHVHDSRQRGDAFTYGWPYNSVSTR
jgi:hypothetical protein